MRSNGFEPGKLHRLIDSLDAIRTSACWLEREFDDRLAKIPGPRRESARNLLHYLALRRRDLRDLQRELASIGLSSMGRAEAHVLGTIDPVMGVLHGLAGRSFRPEHHADPLSIEEGRRRLVSNTDSLLGSSLHLSPPGSDGATPIRVMVTMPSTAAEDYPLVRDLVAAGMNCMRVNCAHDDALAWSMMTAHLRRASEEVGASCRLFMDLGGPKLRTGPIEPGPRVLHWSPRTDVRGAVVAPALLWLTPFDRPEICEIRGAKMLPLDRSVLDSLRAGDRLEFRDLRDRPRSMRIRERVDASWIAESHEESYLGPATPLRVHRESGGSAPSEFFADALLPTSQALSLMAGDRLVLTADQEPQRPVDRDSEGRLLGEARIGCTIPQVFSAVNPGERIFFDDGKFAGVVVETAKDEILLEITHPALPKSLRAEKGINFPDTDLDLPALTEKDLEDLDFIVDHADIVGLSFVNRPEDVEELRRELARRGRGDLAIVLKIETERGFRALPMLLLAALQSECAGVMVARGDLAVECGFERLAEIQEEILWVCEAAHVPVIWATQVLDRLSKKGIPTRAEVTDAAMSERAECVMLNKGPHIVESVRLLRDITSRMRGHQEKKMSWLRALRISDEFDR